MNDDRAEVDELMLEITDYKNDYADMAIEKLFRKCSTSWEDSLGQPNTGVLWLAADPSCGNWCRTSNALYEEYYDCPGARPHDRMDYV